MNVRKLSLFVVLMLMLAVAACGGGGTETAATVEPAAEEPAAEEPAAEEPAAEEPAATDLGTAENPIVMSFVPSGDTQDIIASGDTLAMMLSEATGLVVEANVGTDFSAVREAMCAGQAHIGWLNTFNYVMANEQCGVDAGLVTSRFDATTYSGQIIVRADSGIETLARLGRQGHVLG
jgi:ABC-type phosphate/phosphonate transport system substrate-binding protein